MGARQVNRSQASRLAQLIKEYSRRRPPDFDVMRETWTSIPGTGTHRGQGYANDPLVNKVIEEHAMRRAGERFRRTGYNVEDTSATHSFDLRRRGGTDVVRMEVKGLQGEPDSFLLAAAEVAVANGKDCRTDLFGVYGIEVVNDDGAVKLQRWKGDHVERSTACLPVACV
jgi:hypothetical protein